MNIAEFAKQLSHELHAGQFRNDGKTPYTVHTDWVGDNVWKYYGGFLSSYDNLINSSIGYLHDVIEDCNINCGELFTKIVRVGFRADDANTISSCVWNLSRFSKDDSIINYLTVIKSNPRTRAVKYTDLEHNLSDLKAGNLRDKYMLCQNFLLSD